MFSQVQSEADSAELGPREAGSIIKNVIRVSYW